MHFSLPQVSTFHETLHFGHSADYTIIFEADAIVAVIFRTMPCAYNPHIVLPWRTFLTGGALHSELVHQGHRAVGQDAHVQSARPRLRHGGGEPDDGPCTRGKRLWHRGRDLIAVRHQERAAHDKQPL